MISKSTIKLIKSLAYKKFRLKEKIFLVEGDKNVLELLSSQYHIHFLYATKKFLSANKKKITHIENVIETNNEYIKKASLLINPQNCIAICRLSDQSESILKLDDNLTLYLDGIQDPGNVGTIIRICDWFGIRDIFCSADTADFYSPKVIQASMGSFCRVNVSVYPFEQIFELAQQIHIPVYGTFLDGENIYSKKLPKRAIIVVGNEGKGIRKSIEKKLDTKITIPRTAQKSDSAESLNVGIATGIVCAEFRRQQAFN